MGHQSKSHGSKHHGSKKHHGSSKSHSSSSHSASHGGDMLGPYIYDTQSPSEVPYQGQPKTKDQRRQEMKNYLDNFDQQFYTQNGQASYQQGYGYAGTGR